MSLSQPTLQVWVGGTFSATGSPDSTITLPYPDPGGGIRQGLQDSIEEETLNMTRVKDITGAKVGYVLNFSGMDIAIYEALYDAIYLNLNKDFYFQYGRWPQSATYVKVFPKLSDEVQSTGVANPAVGYDVACSLTLIEAVSRV